MSARHDMPLPFAGPRIGRAPLRKRLAWLAWPVCLGLVYAVPVLLGGSPRLFSTLVTIAIFSVMTAGLDVVVSYLGEVSLGHTIFWAAGGYCAAILSVDYRWNGWMTAAAATVVCVVLAFLLGLATLRTREFVFSLVTYAAAVVAMEVVFNTDAFGGLRWRGRHRSVEFAVWVRALPRPLQR